MNKFPSIEQFRHVIRNVRDHCNGLEELPTIQYIGTVKIHGTNGGIDVTNGKISYLSRNRVLTEDSDNAGFMNAMLKKETFQSWLIELSKVFTSFQVFGEWCGPGIQSGVGITQIPEKIFVIFAVKFGDFWSPINSTIKLMGDSEYFNHEGVYWITQFGMYEKEINFNKPEFIQNTLVELTQAVEAECPVARHFGVSGIGEGIVWSPIEHPYINSKYWFKAKGDKHTTAKVSKIVEIDAEAIYQKQQLVEAIVTPARLEQGITEHISNGFTLEMRDISHYLRWVFNDTMKEESDRVEVSGFNQKELGKDVSAIAKRYFIQKANSTVVG